MGEGNAPLALILQEALSSELESNGRFRDAASEKKDAAGGKGESGKASASGEDE